jgi:hypothetical protein
MRDALAVQVCEHLDELLDQSLGFLFRQCLVIEHAVLACFLSLQMLVQTLTLDVLHDHVHERVSLEGLGKLHDVLMA